MSDKLFLNSHLFAGSDDLFQVILLGKALDGGQRLAAVPLLNPDVD